jgi:hypothetical protein
MLFSCARLRTQTLEMLQRTGVEIFTDGEMRRDGWQTVLSPSADGFAEDYPTAEERPPDGTTRTVVRHGKAVVAKLRPCKRLSSGEASFPQSTPAGRSRSPFPAPSLGTPELRPRAQSAYRERSALTDDLVAIIRECWRSWTRAPLTSSSMRALCNTRPTSSLFIFRTTKRLPGVIACRCRCRKLGLGRAGDPWRNSRDASRPGQPTARARDCLCV